MSKRHLEVLTKNWSHKSCSPLVRVLSFVGITANMIHDEREEYLQEVFAISVQKMFLFPLLS
jgi:hypothetical protein